MQVTLEIPDELTQYCNLEQSNISQKLLELLVAEAYRTGSINTAQVGRLLKLSSHWETHTFFNRMGIDLNYDVEEFERDLQTIKKLRKS